ncbi:MAG: hypothetical protein QMD13_09600 [Candidatus Bathyarchaeia archaeon]|nr:hypothetical protein [Candidatus Bathyarchaeia archaeon]
MKRKKEKGPQEKKLFSSKKLIIISILVAAIVLGFVLSSVLLQTQEAEFSFEATIIDQLGEEFPNSEFNETGVVASILKSAGFNTSYHRSETIDVTFYKGLAKYNYGIIILRAHSATREGETIVDFFTSEKFNVNKYVSEQDNGLLTKGYYSWKPEEFYFAITPKFIENLDGCFPKSIVIAMGCNSLNKTCIEMAEAFIKKGAEAYIGWTGLVKPSHTDNETIRLLRSFLVENKTLSEAVDTVKLDPFYGSGMKYYPLGAGNLTISSLLVEVKGSATHQSAITLFEPIITVYIYRVTLKIRRISNMVYIKLACYFLYRFETVV